MSYNLELGKAILIRNNIQDYLTFDKFAGTLDTMEVEPFLYLANPALYDAGTEFVPDEFKVLGYWMQTDKGSTIHLNRTMEGLVHEWLHHFENVVLGTRNHDHVGWDARGWFKMSNEYAGQCRLAGYKE